MRILKLSSRGFGPLKGSYAFAPAGLNLVVAPNEAGKTTLAEAVREALYGPLIPDRRSHQGRSLAALAPRRGDAFDVTLEVEAGGRKLVIARDFGRGSAHVYADGEDITDSFRAGKDRLEIGERLLGLSRDAFSKSVLVVQGELGAVHEAADLTEVLQRLADSEGGQSTAAGALGAIDRVLHRYPLARTGTVSAQTERKRLEAELENARSKYRALEARRAAHADDVGGVEELEARRQALAVHLEGLSRLEQAALLQETQERLEADEAQRRTVRLLEAELETLADAASFPAHEEETVTRWTHETEAARERRAQLEAERERLDERVAERQREIDALGPVGSFGEEDAHAVRSLTERLSGARQAVSEVRAKLEAESRALEAETIRPAEAEAAIQEVAVIGPEERSFVRGIEAARRERAARAHAEEEKLEASRALLDSIQAERSRGGRAARLVLGAGLLLGAAAVAVYVLSKVLPAAAALGTAALLLLAFGVYRLLSVSRTRADEWREALARSEEAAREKQSLREQAEEEGRRLAALAVRLPSRAPEELPGLIAEAERLATRTEGLRALAEQERERGRDVQAALEAAAEILERAQRPGTSDGIEERLRRLDADAARSLELARAHAEAALQQQDLERRLAAESGRLDQARAALEPVLARAGLDPDLEPASLRESFSQHATRARRHASLRDEELPRERSRVLESSERQALESQRDRLERELGSEARALPEGTPRAAELRRQQEDVRQQLEAIKDELSERRTRAGGEYDALRKELPATESEMEELARSLARLERFQRAASIARETLSKLGIQVHALWADALNRHASEVFAALLPRYRTPRFDPSLRLSFEAEGDPAAMSVEPDNPWRLSAGTLDQAWFVTRLAVARYLASGDEVAPLILDDPFVHFDDERFRAAMRLLVELASERQILLLSCHEARHGWLEKVEPDACRSVRRVALDPSA